MKNVTAGRLGGFIKDLFKSSSWREAPQEPSSWSAWRPAKDSSSWKVVVQDLVFDKKRNTTDAGLKPSSMTLCDERHSGFTLIELLVVVLIIGIMAAIAMPQYQKAVLKARMIQGITLLNSIKSAEESYYMANGFYTQNFDDLDLSMPAGGVTEEGVMRYSNGFTYYLMSPADPHSIYASYGPENRMAWMIYLNNVPSANKGQVKCYSYNNNKITEAVCQGLGGKNKEDKCGGDCQVFTVK